MGGVAICAPRSDRRFSIRLLLLLVLTPLRPFAQHFHPNSGKRKREKKWKTAPSIDFFCRSTKSALLCGFYFFFVNFISVRIGKDIGKVFFFLFAHSSRMFMGDFFLRSIVCSLRMHESVLFAIRFAFFLILSFRRNFPCASGWARALTH